jgi:hypothetical protein
MPKKLDELLEASAKDGLRKQRADGSMPSGCNGPYRDPETPTRNTAHWLFLFASRFAVTGDIIWKHAGSKAIEYLVSSMARPGGKTFHCRDKEGKDSCNGLVGQAWVIESLLMAAEAFGCQDCYKLAEEVFLLHPWDGNVGIWQRVEVDGTVLSYDRTFNHQLWFAAAGGLLTKTPLAQKRAVIFLEKVAAVVQLYPDGVIFHASALGELKDYLKDGPKPFLRELKSRIKNTTRWSTLYSKSVGYHGFNLYALAMLKKTFPEASFWGTEKFRDLLAAHGREEFIRAVKCSEFGYRYNISGIEIAYAVETFYQDSLEASTWLNRQLDETYLCETQCLSLGAADPNTAMARIYQAARLTEDYEVMVECDATH